MSRFPIQNPWTSPGRVWRLPLAIRYAFGGSRPAGHHRPDVHGDPESRPCDQIFAGSGHTLPELFALADASKPLPRFPLVGTIEASVTTETNQVESPNVVGIFPGVDPKLKNDYVVVSAHLDHVGVGEPINGDRIYNRYGRRLWRRNHS